MLLLAYVLMVVLLFFLAFGSLGVLFYCFFDVYFRIINFFLLSGLCLFFYWGSLIVGASPVHTLYR
jgi:hypothetical protein